MTVLDPLPKDRRRGKGSGSLGLKNGFNHVRRCGLIAVKCGMTQEWDSNGVRLPLTVLWIDDNRVVQTLTPENHGYLAVQVSAGFKKHKRTRYAQQGHYERWLGDGTHMPRHSREFRITEHGVLPTGTQLGASHFHVGQFVDIQGRTKGKGFQGAMKRWGFAGGPASHGTSKAHRAIGSTGQCQDPGKVFKGKKMAGRMGNRLRTVQGLRVYKVDPQHNLIWVIGCIPGNEGGYVYVTDAVRKYQDVPLPLPTAPAAEDIRVLRQGTKTNPFPRWWGGGA